MFGLTYDELILFVEGIWKMKWLLFPPITLFLIWALYDVIETKWESRFKSK